jgi:transposase
VPQLNAIDLTQTPPQPESINESHEWIKRLWDFARSLVEKLHTNSKNSSLAPSQTKLKPSLTKVADEAKVPDWELRTPAYWKSKKPGGQKGHAGFGRVLLPEESVHQVIPCHPYPICHTCRSEVTLKRICQRKQVFDLSDSGLYINEYQVHEGICVGCKKRIKGRLPKSLTKGILTSTTLSKIALLLADYRLSRREVKRLLEEFFNLKLSVGTISNAERLVSDALKAPYDEIAKSVQASDYMHLDETSHVRSGQLEWLWIATGQDKTFFKITDNRAQSSAKLILGEGYLGMIITDRYGAYNWLPPKQRQYCWAHLKRDFTKLCERFTLAERRVGWWLLETFKSLFYWYDEYKQNPSNAYALRLCHRKVRRFYYYLKKGTKLVGSVTGKFCQKLLRQRQSLWHFIRYDDIEPTNNLAERQLRHAVLWRKKSFGTRSKRGNRFWERMLTIIMTARQTNQHAVQLITTQLESNKQEWVLK